MVRPGRRGRAPASVGHALLVALGDRRRSRMSRHWPEQPRLKNRRLSVQIAFVVSGAIVVGAGAHVLERGRRRRARARRSSATSMLEPRRQPPHLALEIAPAGRRSAASRRSAGRARPRTSADDAWSAGGSSRRPAGVGSSTHSPEPLDLGLGSRRRPCGEHLHRRRRARPRVRARRAPRACPCSSQWLSHDRNTSRGSRPTQMYVTSGSCGQPVERRVRLDEPTMRLRVEVGAHRREIAGQHVEPGRDEVERPVEASSSGRPGARRSSASTSSRTWAAY